MDSQLLLIIVVLAGFIAAISYYVTSQFKRVKEELKGKEGDVLVDIPMCVNNISSVNSRTGMMVKKDFINGRVWFSGETKDINIRLLK